MHELYLQLRLDSLSSTLKPNRDKTFELGALALQAEYSDRRDNTAQYFQVDNYLPKVNLSVIHLRLSRGYFKMTMFPKYKASYPRYTHIIMV